MAHWRTRKDGTRYQVKSVLPKGVSRDEFQKLLSQDAKRSPTARAIDKGIRAPYDFKGDRWAQHPNRLDYPGIDDPKMTPADRRAILDQIFKSKALRAK